MIAGGRLKMPPKLLPAAIFQWRIRQTFFFFFLIRMVKCPKYQAKQQQSLRGEVPVLSHRDPAQAPRAAASFGRGTSETTVAELPPCPCSLLCPPHPFLFLSCFLFWIGFATGAEHTFASCSHVNSTHASLLV